MKARTRGTERMNFSELIPVVQMAVGPVILISGVGLLLLSMTNRLGRVIDRTRLVAESLRKSEGKGSERYSMQLEILQRRAGLLRRSITMAVFSVLMAACLVITVFVTALFQSNMGLLVAVLFLAAMIFLIISLVVFIRDIDLSLEALKLEIADVK